VQAASKFENDLAQQLSNTLPSIGIQTLTRKTVAATVDYASRGLPLLLLDTQERAPETFDIKNEHDAVSPAETEMMRHAKVLREHGTYEMYWFPALVYLISLCRRQLRTGRNQVQEDGKKKTTEFISETIGRMQDKTLADDSTYSADELAIEATEIFERLKTQSANDQISILLEYLTEFEKDLNEAPTTEAFGAILDREGGNLFWKGL